MQQSELGVCEKTGYRTDRTDRTATADGNKIFEKDFQRVQDFQHHLHALMK